MSQNNEVNGRDEIDNWYACLDAWYLMNNYASMIFNTLLQYMVTIYENEV